MYVQSGEETGHAMKLYAHLVDRGGVVSLGAIAAPQTDWAGPMAAFKAVYEHEQFITGSINGLYETALAEKDYAAQVLLQWFINEQVEEEKNAVAVIDSMNRIEAHETAVLQLDHQLGKRGKE
jgi:ferritin